MIKKYLSFIKESKEDYPTYKNFSDSPRCNEIIKENSILTTDEIEDLYMPLIDSGLVSQNKQSYIRYIRDGVRVALYYLDRNMADDFYIAHSLNFHYGVESSNNRIDIDIFNKSISKIHEISNSFEKVSKRISTSYDMFIDKINIYRITQNTGGNTNSDFYHFEITFVQNKKIDKKIFDDTYINWLSEYNKPKSIGQKIKEISNWLYGEYKKDSDYDINSIVIDYMEHGDIVNFGYFAEDEIMDLGHLDKKTGEFFFNRREYENSLTIPPQSLE